MKKTTTIIGIIVVLALIILAAVWLNKRNMTVAPTDTITQSPVVIIDSPIQEVNFTGSRPVITGSSVVVSAANQYIENEIALFKQSADIEVPQLRKDFGEDAPPSHYSLDFKAKYITSTSTESLVIDGYRYTGGANGMSFYKVITAKKEGDSILALDAVVKNGQYESFTAYIKAELVARQQAIFIEDVQKLTFDSFRNFSFDDTSMIIYFDKYDIGPGALGAVAFPLPLSEVQQYVQL